MDLVYITFTSRIAFLTGLHLEKERIGKLFLVYKSYYLGFHNISNSQKEENQDTIHD